MLEDAEPATSSPTGCRSWSTGCASCRSSPTSRATCRTTGSAAFINIDRDTAARFGITAATVDNALYDAFGQRIVSTIFTQSNQYRVILEADPKLQNIDATRWTRSICRVASGGQVPLSAIATFAEQPAPLQINHLGQFPATTSRSTWRRAPRSAQAVDAITAAEAEIGMPASIIDAASRARRSPSRSRSATSCC